MQCLRTIPVNIVQQYKQLTEILHHNCFRAHACTYTMCNKPAEATHKFLRDLCGLRIS